MDQKTNIEYHYSVLTIRMLRTNTDSRTTLEAGFSTARHRPASSRRSSTSLTSRPNGSGKTRLIKLRRPGDYNSN